MVSSYLKFWRQLAKGYRNISAVAPSSRFLARAMCSPIPWDRCQTILELGPGTGVFTKEIVHRMRPDSRLLLIERDEAFCSYLRPRFPQATVVCGNIKNLEDILQEQKIDSLDATLSGLPILSIQQDVLTSFYRAMRASLSEQGVFTQFTYSARIFKRITKPYVEAEIESYVPCNIPPAFVMKLKIKSL